jgi:RNA polymerase sigma factor (sigma-70 family)
MSRRNALASVVTAPLRKVTHECGHHVIIDQLARLECVEAMKMKTANALSIDMTMPLEITDLYEQHYTAVYRTALRITGNVADAEDALQTVFLRVLNREEPLRPDALEAYFRRAAANAALDLLRRRVSHKETQINEAALNIPIENAAFLKMRLRKAIAVLEHDDAVAFSLRYIEGLSNGELAELFGQDKNNIAVRLHRIRQTLKTEMER